MKKRSKEEILQLVLSVAKADERIRMVALGGSRVNPGLSADAFQDFDIVYLVEELESFVKDPAWHHLFGETIISQLPEAPNFSPDSRRFAYLMLFTDGNRIDLSLRLLADVEEYLAEDSLVHILLDKDGRVDTPPTPSPASHLWNPPCEEEFILCQNEFWWVSTYVAKGLRREQLLYAVHHMHCCVLDELLRMRSWKVVIDQGKPWNPGHSYKHLEEMLSSKDRERLYSLYQLSSLSAVWDSLFASMDWMKELSEEVGAYGGYPVYPPAKRVEAYITQLYEKRDKTKAP